MNFVTHAGRLLVSQVAGFIAALLLYRVGHIHFLPPVLLIPLCLVAAWFLLPRLFPAFKAPPKAENAGPITLQANGRPFYASHHTKNVAINSTTGQVWLRDTKGKEWVLESTSIRNWNHEWTDRSNGNGVLTHGNNYLVITTNDVDHPTHKISMGGHFKHEHAKEWHARLTAMLKS